MFLIFIFQIPTHFAWSINQAQGEKESATVTALNGQVGSSPIKTSEEFKHFMAHALSGSAGLSEASIEVFRGMYISETDAKMISETLKKDPNNLTLHLNFAGFESALIARSWRTEDPEGDENILWLIRNHPELNMPGVWSEFFIHSGKVLFDAKKSWINHVESQRNNIDILCSAADYFIYAEPERSESLLEKASKIDPKNPSYKTEQKRFNAVMKSHGALDKDGKLKSIPLGGNTAEISKTPLNSRLELKESDFFPVSPIRISPDNLKNVVLGKVSSSKEFSADLYMAMDSKNLNVLAQVHQTRSPFNHEDQSHLFFGDSVEIWISGQPETRRYPRFKTAPEDYYLIMAPTSISGKSAFFVEHVGDKNVTLKYSKTSWGYSLLASFPLDDFYGQAWAEGNSYRFECAITKTDSSGQRDAKIFWNSESDDVWKVPDLRGIATIKTVK
jgi:hypothetical protein